MKDQPGYRWKDALRLAGVLRGRGPEIAEKLEPRMATVLEDGEKMPDVAHLLDVLGRMVVAEARKLEAKDRKKFRDATRTASARFDLRRQAMPLLRARVKQVREWMKGHLDPRVYRIVLDHKGRTPRSQEGLENFALGLVRRLSKLKPIQAPSGPVDPAGWADYLREPLQQTGALLGNVERHAAEKKKSTQKKTRAMRDFDRIFRQVARIGSILSHMGGLERVASSLVYKGGRPGVKTKKPRGGPHNVA